MLYIIDSRAAVTAETPEEAADVYFNLTGFCYDNRFGVTVRSVNEGGVIYNNAVEPILPHKEDKLFRVFSRKGGEFYVMSVEKCF